MGRGAAVAGEAVAKFAPLLLHGEFNVRHELERALSGESTAEEIDAADAICERLGITEARLADLVAAAGGGPAPSWAAKMVSDWALCGGAERRGMWPRAGALDEQDAATVFWFDEIDRLAREAGRRAIDGAKAEAEARVARARRPGDEECLGAQEAA